MYKKKNILIFISLQVKLTPCSSSQSGQSMLERSDSLQSVSLHMQLSQLKVSPQTYYGWRK